MEQQIENIRNNIRSINDNEEFDDTNANEVENHQILEENTEDIGSVKKL